jgi:hypothetical protein
MNSNKKKSTASKTVVDGLKQLQLLIPALLPYITSATKLPVFQFLNPTIAQELWPVASILSLLASATNFNLARSWNKRTLALNLCLIGFIAAVLSFLAMIAIVDKLLFASDPAYRDFSVQVVFLFFFIGIGFASGWAFSKILG